MAKITAYGFLFAALLVVSAVGEERAELPARMRIIGEAVSQAFGEPAENLEACTVAICSSRNDPDDVLLLGAVVSPDGFIVTKASDLPARIWVAFADGEIERAKLIGKDRVNDVAFLKIDRATAEFVSWGSTKELKRGHWLASVVPGDNVFHVGVVSANRRSLARSGGVLGVMLGRDGAGIGGIMVGQVMEQSGARAAGLERGDVITAINGEQVLTTEELKEIITSHDAQDIVVLSVERGVEELELSVELGHRAHVFERTSRNQLMSGNTSKRRVGFNEIVQHDIPLEAQFMGGPVVGLDGKAVGLNIARANRAETYLLPAEEVLSSIERILNGEIEAAEGASDL